MIRALARPASLVRSSPDFARIAAVNFLFFMQFASGFIYPRWLLEQGLGERAIGVVMGSAGVATLVTTLVLAGVIDRMSRLRILRWGIVILVLATLILRGAAGSMLLLCGARALQGAAFAAAFMTAGSLATEYAPGDRTTEALGLFGVFTLLTHALAPLLAEQYVRWWNWDAMFVLSSVYSVVAWQLSWRLRDPDADRVGPDLRAVSGGWGRAEVSLLLLTSMVGIAFGTMVTYLPVWAARLHGGSVGAFFATYACTAIGVRILFGHLGDRLAKARLVAPASLIVAVCSALIGVAGGWAMSHGWSIPFLVVAGLLYGLGHGFFYPNANVQYLDIRPPQRQGEAMSHFMLAFNVGGVVAGMLFGSVIELAGYSVTYAVCAAAVGVALVAYWQVFNPAAASAGR